MKISFLIGDLKFFNSYAFVYPIYKSMNYLKNNYDISIHYTNIDDNYDVTFLDSK